MLLLMLKAFALVGVLMSTATTMFTILVMFMFATLTVFMSAMPVPAMHEQMH
ncbi:hypothetical protein D3C76_1670240 [compost metagenome]